MSSKPDMHTGMWKGHRLNLSRAGWARKLNKSGTFVLALLKEAADAGIDQKKRMQFVIDNRDRKPKIKHEDAGKNGGISKAKKKRRRKSYTNLTSFFLHKLPPPRQFDEIEI